MLRNRSRAVTSKQALMADHTSPPSSRTQNYDKSKTPSFFDSPRFKAFTQKGFSENDGLVSPTSILDTKPFFSLTNPFSHPKNQPTSPRVVFPGNKHHSWDHKPEAKGIGLVLNDSLDQKEVKGNTGDQSSAKSNVGNNRKVVLGTNKLRVQIPPLVSPPTEFGIKTRNSHVSSCGSANPCNQTRDYNSSPRPVAGGLVCVDQRSEDYTCVISHGPIPRTTHIFENCIIETYCCLSDHYDDNHDHNCNKKKPKSSNLQPQSFLSFCHTCKKNLQQKIDIYIYRGEKAFCSRECRYQEMVLDGMGNSEFDDHTIRDCC